MKDVQSPPERKRVAVDPGSGSPPSPACVPRSWIDRLLDLLSRSLKTVEFTKEEELEVLLRRKERKGEKRQNP